MALPRVTDLSTPPVVGQWYLVPTVLFGWFGKEREWPVFLPRHEDARFFDFKDEHYHLDPRFISDRILGPNGLASAQRAPLARHGYGKWACEPPGAIWRRRKCVRAQVGYVHGAATSVLTLRDHYAGQTCKHNRHGWVCPHQNWPMGSLAPDEGGVITCPLHGLRVRAADGLVLPTLQIEAA